MKKIYAADGNLIPDVKDALIELCNAGTGMVCVTIGRMLNVRLSITMPHITFLKTETPSSAETDGDSTAFVMHMTDAMSGEVAVIVSTDLVLAAVKTLTGTQYSSFDEMMDDDLGFSAVQEFGNIVGSAYVKAIGKYTGIRFYLSPVMVGVDKFSELVSSAYLQSTAKNEPNICAESEFTMVDADDNPIGQTGRIIMMPDDSSVEKLMEAVGI